MDLFNDESPYGHIRSDDPKEVDIGPDLVKAGMEYEDISPMHKEALKAYAAGISYTSTRPPSEVPLKAIGAETVYTPLGDSQDLRVLELHHGQYDDEICCSLHVCVAALKPQYDYPQETREGRSGRAFRRTTFVVSCVTGQPVWYTALSYVWGDSAFVMPMVCNGAPFRTTVNLDTALRHLRHTGKSIMLWVDQICINQKDLQEKTQQVLLMSKIYERAWNTVVWLGPEGDNSYNATETLLAVKDALKYHTEERAPDIEDFSRLSLPEPGSNAWSHLKEFLDRPWFRRVWVMQEVVLQRNVEILCGRACLRWDDLETFAYCMVKYDMEQFLGYDESVEVESSESGCVRIRMIRDMKFYHDSFDQNSSLFAVLREGRGAGATDPKDKVFGVMGMSDQTVHPDYQRSLADVYTEACASCLNAADVIRLLCSVDHEQPKSGMPSWVPDWSMPRQTTSLGYPGQEHAVYRAATWDANFAGYRLKSLRVENNKTLVTEGFLFDTVIQLSGTSGSTLQDLLVEGTATRSFIFHCVRMVLGNCKDDTSKGGLFEAFWKTLVAGKDHTGVLKAPLEYAEIFALLLDTANGGSPFFPDQPQSKRKLSIRNLEYRRPRLTYREMQIAFKAAVRSRRFCITSKGYMGLFPRGTQLGDQICVFMGAPLPFVLRLQENSDSYLLIGECYVHGLMEGETLNMEDMKVEEIIIA